MTFQMWLEKAQAYQNAVLHYANTQWIHQYETDVRASAHFHEFQQFFSPLIIPPIEKNELDLINDTIKGFSTTIDIKDNTPHAHLGKIDLKKVGENSLTCSKI